MNQQTGKKREREQEDDKEETVDLSHNISPLNTLIEEACVL